MKRWLRFEDKYGMYDIFRIIHGIADDDTEIYHSRWCEDILERGITNPACLRISRAKREVMLKEGVDNIVIIFDMDSPSQRMDGMTAKEFESYAIRAETVTYAPTVWCAETLACVCNGIPISETERPASEVARRLFEGLSCEKTKQLRNILVPSLVNGRLSEFRETCIYNQCMLDVLFDGGLGYTYDEMLTYLAQLQLQL